MRNLQAILFFLLIFSSCTKEIGKPGPAGPQGTTGGAGKGPATDTGTIQGQLALYDEFSFPQTDAGEVIVTLTSGSLKLSDTTSAAGQYHFSAIETGTYDLSYQKPGYGTMKVFGISHFGGGSAPTTVKNVYLLQIPVKTAPDTLYTIVNNGLYINLDFRLDTSSATYQQYTYNWWLFLSKDAQVGFNHYSWKVGLYAGTDGTGGYVAAIGKTDNSNPLPFKTGDTVYAVCYTYNRYVHNTDVNTAANDNVYFDAGDGGFYVDPSTGLTVYPNLSKPSNIAQFIY